MLHRERRLKSALVRGTDGDLGVLERLFFDDQQWAIRDLVVSRDKSLNDGSVLISAASIQRNWNVEVLPANLSRNEIRDSPAIDAKDDMPAVSGADGHLRATEQIIGFHIKATDGEIGHVDDLLIDEDSWRISYLVVDTSNWIGGKSVAISPHVLRSVDWANGLLEVAITREAVKQSPPMDSMPVPSAENMPPFVLM